jgi:hypothetical protein
MLRTRLRRLLRFVAVLAGVLVVLLATLVWYLRRDKTDVFYRVRGQYAGARTLEEWTQGEDRCRLVALENHHGEAVTTAFVRTPRPLPAQARILLTYAGEKTGKAMLELIPHRADLVLVAVQYPYRRPRGIGPYLRWPYDLRRAVFRTVAGGMLAVSFLADEGVSTDRLTVLAVSLGTSFGVIHGALDRRVDTVVVVHGGGDLPAVVGSIERRAGRAWRAPIAEGLAATLAASFDPLRYVGRIAPRRVAIVASRRDRYFPPSSVQALYDRAGQPKSLRWTETEHVGARKRAIVDELVLQIEKELGPSVIIPPLPTAIPTPRPPDTRDR